LLQGLEGKTFYFLLRRLRVADCFPHLLRSQKFDSTSTHHAGRPAHHSGGSTAASYSCLKRAISSAAGRILPTLPTPWPEPQISFQAFGLARSPEASVPKLIFEGSEVGRFSGSMPAATIDGFK